MQRARSFIGRVHIHEPRYASTQADTLAWLAALHTRAERTRAERAGLPFDAGEFERDLARRIGRFGCSPDKIARRTHELADCGNHDFAHASLLRVHEDPTGASTLARTQAFAAFADRAFGELYAGVTSPPAELVHVTCTGYESPSAAQRLVTARGWGRSTRVTHAYQMGCYAAVPAVRLASSGARDVPGARVDVVHTEYCTLHVNPALHTPEQLVIQSLFADGAVRYALAATPEALGEEPEFAVLAVLEETLPDSSLSMSWVCGDAGMHMTLARDVPARIGAELPRFYARLCDAAGLDASTRRRAAHAVHPGGPRVVDAVKSVLGLEDAQVQASRDVLAQRGNLSSATLPHIWHALADERAAGSVVVSLAFGPGLTLCGAVFRTRPTLERSS